MTPAEFMTEIAVPAALEFKADPRSRLRMYLAIIVAFHVRDHLEAAGESGVEAAMRTATGDLFAAVRDVANGAKHGRAKIKPWIGFEAGDDYDIEPGGFSFLAPFGETVGGRGISMDAPAGTRGSYWACAEVLRAYVSLYPQHFSKCDLSGL